MTTDPAAVGDRIEQLLEAFAAAGPVAHERAEELVRLLVDLYGGGLERILDLAQDVGALSDDLLRALGTDPLVSSLLLVHGLHPYGLQERVEQALTGLDATVVAVEDGVVRVRAGAGCGSAAAVEDAVRASAPDAVDVHVAVEAAVIPVASLTERLHGGDGPGMTGLSVLARVRADRPAAPAYERCEMCTAPVAPQHGHVVNMTSRQLLCACRPCYLLFTHDDADLAYRAVPERYLAVPDLPLPAWDELELPVGTAFLFPNSALGRVVALYPGPAGATESMLGLEAWDRLVSAAPLVAGLSPDVEALLVHASGQRVEAYLVPIDVCYELVGHLRQLWRGFDGGAEVRARLDAFFADVRARCR